MSLFSSTSHSLASARSKRGRNAGLSLVEVMVASVLLTMAGICFIAALTQAYRMASLIRYENQARYILRSVADQFLIAGTTNPMLSPSSVYTGVGLAWDGDLQIFCYETETIARDSANDAIGEPNGLVIPLGKIRIDGSSVSNAPINATFMRRVTINTNANATGAAPVYQADFKVKFTFMNQEQELFATAIKTVP